MLTTSYNKLLTVITPVYNGALYIKDAVESALQQDIEDMEYIIINDGCTDNTLDIVRSIQDDRIKIIDNHGNIGCRFQYLHRIFTCTREILRQFTS